MTDRMNRFVGLALIVGSIGLMGLPSANAATVYTDNFDSDTAGAVYVPTGWTDVTNYTTSDTSDTTTTVYGATVAASGAGYPFVDHTTGSGKFVFFTSSSSTNGPSGTSFDKFLISPTLTLNGSAATFSFYAFASSTVSKISVLLSTNGGSSVPNYGAQFTGTTSTVSAATTGAAGTYDNGKTTYTGVATGDFTTTLLAPTALTTYAGAGTPWTLYTVNIPAGLATAYIAIRETGTNATYPNNVSFIGIDDVSVNTVPEPASLGMIAVGAAATLRRRRVSR